MEAPREAARSEPRSSARRTELAIMAAALLEMGILVAGMVWAVIGPREALLTRIAAIAALAVLAGVLVLALALIRPRQSRTESRVDSASDPQ